MAAPPAKKKKDCTMISMVVGKEDCLSPITRIKGYPWRLRSLKTPDGYWQLSVRCEKSMEAELWDCEAVVDAPTIQKTCKFESMDKKTQEHRIGMFASTEGSVVVVYITPSEDGNRWRSRPIVGILEPRDGILLIEDKKMYVNKKSLTSQSPYFDRLFNGDFKEKNMKEIPIGGVSAEEFTNLMRILYGENGESAADDLLTRQNVHRILELADRFELKIVEDGVVNSFFCSPSYSIHERLLIADRHKLSVVKDRVLSLYTDAQLKELSASPQFVQLSVETKEALFKKSCDALTKANGRNKY